MTALKLEPALTFVSVSSHNLDIAFIRVSTDRIGLVLGGISLVVCRHADVLRGSHYARPAARLVAIGASSRQSRKPLLNRTMMFDPISQRFTDKPAHISVGFRAIV